MDEHVSDAEIQRSIEWLEQIKDHKPHVDVPTGWQLRVMLEIRATRAENVRLRKELARRAADAQPAPGVDAELLRHTQVEAWTPFATAGGAVRAEIVVIVEEHRARYGVGPSMRDILRMSRLTDMKAVSAHVNALLARGELDCHRHENGTMIGRSLEVIES